MAWRGARAWDPTASWSVTAAIVDAEAADTTSVANAAATCKTKQQHLALMYKPATYTSRMSQALQHNRAVKRAIKPCSRARKQQHTAAERIKHCSKIPLFMLVPMHSLPPAVPQGAITRLTVRARLAWRGGTRLGPNSILVRHSRHGRRRRGRHHFRRQRCRHLQNKTTAPALNYCKNQQLTPAE